MFECAERERESARVAVEDSGELAFTTFDPDLKQIVVGIGFVTAYVNDDRHVKFARKRHLFAEHCELRFPG